MLKGISSVLPPGLLKVLMEMGHGDELVIGDGNFPAASVGGRVIRCDGHDVPAVLRAVMRLFPLDAYVQLPAALMEVGEPDRGKAPPVRWDEYREIIASAEPSFPGFEMVERFRFYERAREAYAVVATGDRAIYANIILKKGVVTEEPA